MCKKASVFLLSLYRLKRGHAVLISSFIFTLNWAQFIHCMNWAGLSPPAVLSAHNQGLSISFVGLLRAWEDYMKHISSQWLQTDPGVQRNMSELEYLELCEVWGLLKIWICAVCGETCVHSLKFGPYLMSLLFVFATVCAVYMWQKMRKRHYCMSVCIVIQLGSAAPKWHKVTYCRVDIQCSSTLKSRELNTHQS